MGFEIADLAKPPSRRGRRRDETRDPQILDAALAELVEAGDEQMTMDRVAGRVGAGKATLYRRWPTKGHLVLAAIAQADHRHPISTPDHGCLRDDLLATIDPEWLGGELERRAALSALTAIVRTAPELSTTVHTILVEPAAQNYRTIFARAADRGEVRADANLELLAQTLPSMTTYQTIFRGRPADRPFIESIVDDLLLPAVHATPGSVSRSDDLAR